MLHWLKTVVVNDEEKASFKTSGGDREGERKRIAVDVSKLRDDIETGVSMRSRDEHGGCPSIGQVVSGIQATRARSAASVWNRRRRTRKLPCPVGRVRGSVPSGPKP